MTELAVAKSSNLGSRFVAKAAVIKLEKTQPQKIKEMRTRGTRLVLLQPHAVISHPQKPKCVYTSQFTKTEVSIVLVGPIEKTRVVRFISVNRTPCNYRRQVEDEPSQDVGYWERQRS